MESDLGKLFVGGISWDTDEERLKEYFGNYGEVVEAVIMRDRATGRARGFGFVVFLDPAVAERVTRDKHVIDGRSVEAKKAVPREDQHLLNRGSSGSIPGSPSPGRTKKIFVGGLASNVTETDFKNYFDQFGNITDVVVMYDHNTQRPRGFGFISYDSEEAVDRVLHKTFHDLNGKMVEVKRAVPKELSPGPNRSPLIGYNYNLTRVNNILNSYSPGFNLASLGGYRVRMDGGPTPIAMVRGGASPFGASGLGLDQGVGPGGSNPFSSLGYGRMGSPYNNGGNSGRYNTPIGYQGENRRGENQNFRNLWGNGGTANPVNLGNYLGTGGSGSFGVSYGNGGGGGTNWGQAPISLGLGQGGGTGSGYGNGDGSFGLGGDGGGRKSGNFVSPASSFGAASGNLDDGSYGELYRDSSVYGSSNWLSGGAAEMNGPGSFSYGLGSIASDVTARGSEGFVGSYNATGREPNRGIAA